MFGFFLVSRSSGDVSGDLEKGRCHIDPPRDAFWKSLAAVAIQNPSEGNRWRVLVSKVSRGLALGRVIST